MAGNISSRDLVKNKVNRPVINFGTSKYRCEEEYEIPYEIKDDERKRISKFWKDETLKSIRQ